MKVCRCFYATNENIKCAFNEIPPFISSTSNNHYLFVGMGVEWGQVRHRSPRNSGFTLLEVSLISKEHIVKLAVEASFFGEKLL